MSEGLAPLRPALGRTSLAASPAQPYRAPALLPRDVLTTVFLHRPALLIAFLLPLLAGVLAANLVAPRWSAESLLLILATRESVGSTDITGNGPTVVSVESPKVVQSELDILLSDAVMRRAVERLRVTAPQAISGGSILSSIFPWVRPTEPPVAVAAERLRAAIRGTLAEGSNVVRVTASMGDATAAVAALTAVLDSYTAFRTELFAPTDAPLLLIETDRMAQELRALDERIAQARADAEVLDLSQAKTSTVARIDSATQRIDALAERQAATLAQLVGARQRMMDYPARVVAASETTNLTPNDDSRNEMTRLLLQREHMSTQYAADWPPLRELDARIATLRGAMQRNAQQRFSTVREVRNPAVEQLSLRIATLEVDADAMGRQMAELVRQRVEAETRATVLLRAESNLSDLARRREAMEASFRLIAGRETGARLAEEARRGRNPTVHMAQAPTAAPRARDLRLSFILGGLVGGLLLAAATAIFLALFRRSFATTDEAERGLGMTSIVSIGSGVDLHGGARTPAVTDLAALVLDARAGGERLSLIQFVGTADDDGCGVLALSAAAEIARARGLRTMLVDLRDDGRAHLAAMGAQPMTSDGDPESILAFNTVIPDLWIAYRASESLLCDPHAGIERTMALLDRLRRELDVVVLVAPVSQQAYAARRLTALMDANVLVVRAERTTGDKARAARDAVLSAGGRLVGFVMNGERRVVPGALLRLA